MKMSHFFVTGSLTICLFLTNEMLLMINLYTLYTPLIHFTVLGITHVRETDSPVDPDGSLQAEVLECGI